MDFNTGRPNHIEDYLARARTGSWFGWSDPKNKIRFEPYAIKAPKVVHKVILKEN